MKGRLAVRGATLEALITRVYGIRPPQLEGGPGWIRSDRFDISAKAPTDTATDADMFAMIRHLLADRFALRVRTDTRQAPMYKLRLARTDGRFGPGLHRISAACQQTIDSRDQGGAAGGPPPPGPIDLSKPICGRSFMSPVAGNAGVRLTFGGFPLAQLVQRIAADLAAPVVDETGLTGLFDVVLEYERVGRPPAAQGAASEPSPDLPAPPLPSALEQQLGLKLERQVGPTQVLVVEAVERPTPD